MKTSQFFVSSLKEIDSEITLPSHRLLLKAGFIEKIESGLYTYLPLGLRVINKIKKIIQEEMDNVGASETLFPLLIGKKFFVQSNRWDIFAKELFRLEDRHQKEYGLAPTHEEVFSLLVKKRVSSYKQLPLTLYQIGTKFRDEIRPRYGLMRAREFIMKDAYSFHLSDDCLDKTYEIIKEAYCKIFKRLSLEFLIMDADSGAIGGNTSEEFIIKAQNGESEVLSCADCGYNVDVEKASAWIENPEKEESELEKILTENSKTIQELHQNFDIDPKQLLKTVVYDCIFGKETEKETKQVVLVIRGDYQINEKKLEKEINRFFNDTCSNFFLTDDETIQQIFNCPPGYISPVGINDINATLLVDVSVKGMKNCYAGANQQNYHYKNVSPQRDFQKFDFVDIHLAKENDICNQYQKGKMKLSRGIEIGHIFKLGDKYTKALDVAVLDKDGKKKHLTMGCYGIGASRLLSAIVECYHDEDGIVFPKEIAPFQIHLITLDDNEELMKKADEIYTALKNKGIEILWDDRKERPGFKFKEADLIGIPYQITIGKKGFAKGEATVSERKSKDKKDIEFGKVVEYFQEKF